MPTNVCPAVRPVTGIEVPTDGVAGLNDTKVEPDSAYACLKIVIAALSYLGVGLFVSNTVQAPCAPNSGRAPHRSAGPNDQEAPPCRDQTRKRIAFVRPLAAPSWTAPANHRLNSTESRFAHRLNERFATQSGQSGYQRRCGRDAE